MAKIEIVQKVRAIQTDSKKYVQKAGASRVLRLMQDAQADLEDRLAEVVDGPGDDSFTAADLRTSLAQVRHVTVQVMHGLKGNVLEAAEISAEQSAQNTIDALQEGEDQFRGLGAMGSLKLNEASMLDSAAQGAQSSVLSSLMGDPDEGPGVLARYGSDTIDHFEEVLRRGLMTGASRDDVLDELTGGSSFLQGKPRFWAERIARTELHGAYNRAAWESMREADEQLGGDMIVRVLVATIDDRTGFDSLLIHGQIRGLEEPFNWVGLNGDEKLFMTPPNRPNDREVVVVWHKEWGDIPEDMQPLPDGALEAYWHERGVKKQPMPERPTVSTVEEFPSDLD